MSNHKFSYETLFSDAALRAKVQTLLSGIGPGNTRDVFLQGICLKGQDALAKFWRAGFDVSPFWCGWSANRDVLSLIGTGRPYFAPLHTREVFARCEAPMCLLLPCETKLPMKHRYLHDTGSLNDIAAWAHNNFRR